MPGREAASALRPLLVKLCLGFCLCTAVGLLFSVRGSQGISAGSLLASLPRRYVWGALVPFIIWTDRRFAASSLRGRAQGRNPVRLGETRKA